MSEMGDFPDATRSPPFTEACGVEAAGWSTLFKDHASDDRSAVAITSTSPLPLVYPLVTVAKFSPLPRLSTPYLVSKSQGWTSTFLISFHR